MKKVIFFDFAGPYFPGGCEQYFVLLAKHFRKKMRVTFMYSRWYVSVIELVYFILLNHRPGSICYTKRPLAGIKLDNLTLMNFLPFTKARKTVMMSINDADLIYTKNEFFELIFLYIILGELNFKKKVIIGIHSAIFIPDSINTIWSKIHNVLYFGNMYKKLLQSANTIHVVNDSYIAKIINSFEIKNTRIECIPYFIDWKAKKFKKRNKKNTILWAGRFTKQKGILELTKIISRISKMDFFKKTKILIAGDGEEKKHIIDLAIRYENIQYLGYVHDVKRLFNRIDLAIITSNFETFGYNTLEPQSYGIPTISFNIDGPKQIIVNNETGYLVSNTKEFVEKIKSILDIKSDNNRLNSNRIIFEKTNQRFNKKIILAKMNNMFSRTLEE